MRSTPEGFASSADHSACRRTLRGGSKTFFAASLVLPARARRPATSLYAFCRMADDAIDHGRDRSAALADLHARLESIYARAPVRIAVDRAFADCVIQHEIPKALPLALLEGFSWDASMRRYDALADLRAYAVRVAGTVGMMMGMLMGVRDGEALARACDLGVAMQLTNIARDVGEDARCGRLYLPMQWLREAGIEPDLWLAHPTFSPALRAVIERLLATADALYERSEAGLVRLPPACRPAMYAARHLYAEIGHELARRGYDSINQRVFVPRGRKLQVMARAFGAAAGAFPADASGALPEALFLVESLQCAQGSASPLEARHERTRWAPLEDRVAWLVDLFERLERREHSATQTG